MAKKHYAGKALTEVRRATPDTDEYNLLDGGTQASAIADFAITYTTGDPETTISDAITIADGTAISDAEVVEALDKITAKVNAIITALEGFGVVAS